MRRRSELVAVLLVASTLAGCTMPSVVAAGQSAPAPASTSMTGHVTGRWPTDCHARHATTGQPLPDPTCTPGVVSSAVTTATLRVTICRSGYTTTVRPPASETNRFKAAILRAYHLDGPVAAYELDHLVPLEVGGSNDAGNLWPERNDRSHGNSKDTVENRVHAAVCDGRVGLAEAQEAMAVDWTTVETRLGLSRVDRG
jgi:hypothetical protein